VGTCSGTLIGVRVGRGDGTCVGLRLIVSVGICGDLVIRSTILWLTVSIEL
jgi:hypothetical protein